jgi:uncharacterized protein (TIGR02588 family)
MSPREGRSAAEWATFTGSCAVVTAVLVLIGVQLLRPRTEAQPVAAIGATTEVGEQHFVEVTVTNGGDATAANVQVRAELAIGDRTTDADQTIDFLAGDEEQTITFVFADAPEDGQLTVAVSSFSEP